MDGLALVAAVVALFMAFGMRSRLTGLQVELANLREEFRTLATRAALGQPPAAEPSPQGAPEEVISPEAGEPVAELNSEPAEAPGEPAGADAPITQPAPAAAGQSLEERLGTRWAVWVGGLALALGGILLVRYSIEQGIFGPGARITLGALFSLALVAAGEWFRRSERASPVASIPAAHIPSILTAAGTVSAFGTVYAAHALYQFIGPGVAFVALGAIGIATMLAAALHGPALAGLGLAGAFVVPLLVQSQQPSPWPLVLYLAVVAVAAYALARMRRWLWLAGAVVAGAFIWGLVLVNAVEASAAGSWASALYVHVVIQLALAAMFMAVEPHAAVRDDAAEPDWIATVALAVLTILVVLALAAARFNATWSMFAALAMIILGATAWRTAPAAAAAPLAGAVALGAIAVWPGLNVPPDPQLLAPALEGVLRLPENITRFLSFAAISTLAIAAVAVLRLWQGRTLPVRTAGLYALASVVAPLLALILAYLRVTQFDRSLSFAFFAVVLAGLFYVVADRFDNVGEENKTPATRLAVGAHASGVAAAMTLAFVMALSRGYLTVAFAVTALTTAIFATVDRIWLLRYVVAAIGFIVLGRLVWDPTIMGADVGTWPIFNWLLLGYGAPAVAFLGAGYILKRDGEDLAVRLCDALGVLFAALLVFFEIRHAVNGGDPLAPTSGHVEQGLFAFMSLAFAALLIRLDLARANPIFRWASLIFGVISGLITLFALGIIENPLFNTEPVRGPVIFSTLLLGYLLPALAAIVLARTARGVRPQWYLTGAAVLAVLLLFGYVTLEVRHAFQGEQLSINHPTSAPEVWSYSVAWLVLGLAFLGYGLVRGSKEARLASLVLVLLSVVKVFLYDLTGIGGFWRAFSVICLGLVLVGIGLVYQKLVFARPQSGALPPEPSPAAGQQA